MIAAVALLAACDSAQPPIVCDTLPDDTLFVHQGLSVTPCFEDPEMGEITMSVVSSDTGSVTARVVGYTVAIRAVSVGRATITVTATDPDMLTASTSFTVEVPNRPPWRRGRMPDADMFSGHVSVRLVSDFFSDPDNQELTYSATSSNRVVVSASLFGDSLVLNARREGTSVLTVTATDPGGESVSQESTITVSVPVDIFRDDFETEASFDDWELGSNSDAVITQGRLQVYNVVAGLLGWIETEVAAAPWEASASMGNATDSVFVGLVAVVDHSRFPAYLIQIGTDYETFDDELGRTNYRFFIWDNEREVWVYADGWYGTSPLVADVGLLTEVTLTAQGGDLTVHMGGQEVVRVDLVGRNLSDDLTFLAVMSWPKCCETGHAGVVDWVELRGISVDGSSMAGSRTTPGIGGRLPEIRLEPGIFSESVRLVPRGR